MVSTQGEIRVGPSHQARLPENRLHCFDLNSDPELFKEREEIRWVPNMTSDGDLVMYLRAARSVAVFAGYRDGGSAEDGYISASRDGTTINAYDVLHDSNYDLGKALQTLLKCPVPKSIDKRWSEEETKRFVKGLRQFGKNFFRIRKDLLPHKETPELVEFYYLWKKTPGANNNRPHRRRRPGSLRRRNTRSTKAGASKEEIKEEGTSSRPSSNPKDQGDGSSGSDDDNSYDDSDSKENGGYRCQHCFTKNSRDWQHATSGPKQGALLCYTCRSHYKQFGELPPIGRSEAPYLFQPVQADSPESSPGRMRTRNKTKETPTKEKPKGKRADRTTPDLDLDKKLNGVNDKSPMSSSNSPNEKQKRKGSKTESVQNRKRTLELDEDDDCKRKRESGMDSPLGSDLSDSESADEPESVNISPAVEEKDVKPDLSDVNLQPVVKLETIVKTESDSKIGDSSSTSFDNSNTVKQQSLTLADIKETEENADNVADDNDGMSRKPTSSNTFVTVKKEEQQSQPTYYQSALSDDNVAAATSPNSLQRAYNGDMIVPPSEDGVIIKPDGIFDSPSPPDDRDEILPPVLSSDDSYVPKEEMPTLHISANVVQNNTSPFSPTPPTITNNYSPPNSYNSVMINNNVVGIKSSIKLETNGQVQCDNIPDESLLQHPPSSPSPLVPRQSDSPIQLTAYSQISESSQQNETDKSHPQSVLLPPYPPYAAEIVDQNDKPATVPSSPSNNNDNNNGNINSNNSSNSRSSLPTAAVPTLINLSQQQHPSFPPYYFPPPHPAHLDKIDAAQSYLTQPPIGAVQMEPQDLKIKQEVIAPDHQRPPSVDPLQSLKEVKVPGFPTSSVSQQPPLLPPTNDSVVPNSDTSHHSLPNNSRSESNSPLMAVSVNNIKKEITESPYGVTGAPSAVPISLKSPTVAALKSSDLPPRNMSPSRHTPPYSGVMQSRQSPNSRTPVSSPIMNPSVPTSVPQSALMHPSQQQSSPVNRVSPAATQLAHPHPYVPSVHPHHPLIQHSLFAAAAAAHAAAVHHNPYSHHPYAGYPFPYGPYGPYPIPQPIPPPRSVDTPKREVEGSSTILTSHQSSSSSSSITTRSVRDDDSNVHAQEIMQTHHHSSSHHASIHHHTDKQTISHSTSSTSSASIQHKVKRSSSPQHSSSTCHVSATLSQSTSSSVSSTNHGGQGIHHSHHHHQHQHQHQHTHHHQTASTEPMSPLLNMSVPLGASNNSSRNGTTPAFGNSPQGKQPHPSVLAGSPSVLSNHHASLALAGLSPSGSLEALRAHAHAAALHNPLQLQQSPHGLPPGHPGYLPGTDIPLNPDMIKSEPMLAAPEEGMLGIPEEEELPSPTHHIPKGPSPEPKIEDAECHRSQSAIFLRHWNRGDYNSCARTDLTFKPVPDSKLARKREERLRKQAEKEREEKEKAHSRKLSTPDKPDAVKPPSRGPIETITSPYDRFAATRGTPYADTPALRQLSEYARPHTSFSPVTLQRSAASLGIPPQCIDPMLHYQLNMYGSSRERLEMEHFEREKREREFRELREKELSDRLKEEIMKTAGSRLPNSVDPHWLDLQRRFSALGGPGAPALHPFGLYAAATGPGQAPSLSPLERERLERLGSNGASYPRPGLIPGRDAAMGLHHPSDLLARPYADQLAHQAAAHEHLQRQMMLERERYPHPALVAQHEEYIRFYK